MIFSYQAPDIVLWDGVFWPCLLYTLYQTVE
jgi:hypothetical protein